MSTDDVLGWAERSWNGEVTQTSVHFMNTHVGFAELRPGVGFMAAFSNAAPLMTEEGLVMIDTSSMFHAANLHAAVRAWTKKPLHTAVYTHGHVDHVFGLPPFEAEGPVRVIAHRACPMRFDRYRLTRGYNGIINARQFALPTPWFPGDFRYPDQTFDDKLRLEVGGLVIELFHDRGETDDHVWAHIPSARAIYTGDLFIWSSPNCGNPQKVQRYPAEWAAALRKMQALDAEVLMPGHGPPILGAERVRQALDETAALLESLCEQTLRMLNEGAPLDDILHTVKAPAGLLGRPYLRPLYDDPEFVVRNLHRLYAGWWDGNAANLKPARGAELAGELAALCGGADALAKRAQALRDAGQLALAGHLIELALRASPDSASIRTAYAAINEARAEAETSLMAKGIFRAAARSVS